jgi:glycosyltransferase involved in cell wall biosynthesis
VVAAALTAFAGEYGADAGRPVCVVIAALNEAPSVGDVIRSLPPQVADLAVECLVIDDGSTDGTAAVARDAGALVCRFEHNLGQGQALRAGYRLAADRRAHIIVTMDADGQFDTGEMDRLVDPIATDRADMVQGSRRLGTSTTTDPVRAAGVVVFGGLISLLTRTRITDPANGFRAFRPEVPERVQLRQPQYQTAELLIGALAAGFRVIEAPVTVLPRTAGESKKGRNLLYGYRFAGVIITTWWRVRKAREQPRR